MWCGFAHKRGKCYIININLKKKQFKLMKTKKANVRYSLYIQPVLTQALTYFQMHKLY
jgi:hypothetical protein